MLTKPELVLVELNANMSDGEVATYSPRTLAAIGTWAGCCVPDGGAVVGTVKVDSDIDQYPAT
jgi:hypothetical protein